MSPAPPEPTMRAAPRTRLRSGLLIAGLALVTALGGEFAAVAAPAQTVIAAPIQTVVAAPTQATSAADKGIRARAHRAPAVSREVYAYLPYWQVDAGTADRLDYSLVSTIAFFAVPVRANGSLNPSTPGYRAYVSSAATAVTNAAHRRGVRVVPTFQLFNVSKMRHLLSSRAAQNRFIHQALTLMARRRADGANIDFEPVPRALAAKFAKFVGRFGRKMHARFPGSRLVVATMALASHQLIGRLAHVVDRFFIMAYDFHYAGSGPGAVAPMRGRVTVKDAVARYRRHVGPGRLILGVPFYGYSWPVKKVRGIYRLRRHAGRYGGVRAVTYAGVQSWLDDHPGVKVHTDKAGGAWFRYWNAADRTTRQVHFETAGSARAKFNYAIANGLAGVGIWTLEGDRGYGGMDRAVRTTFVHPTRKIGLSVVRARVGLVRGSVRVTATIRVRDRGNRAERGVLTWRVLNRAGRVIASGRRTIALYARHSARVTVPISLGSARLRAAGTYRVKASFRSDHRAWSSRSVRFYQPY